MLLATEANIMETSSSLELVPEKLIINGVEGVKKQFLLTGSTFQSRDSFNSFTSMLHKTLVSVFFYCLASHAPAALDSLSHDLPVKRNY